MNFKKTRLPGILLCIMMICSINPAMAGTINLALNGIASQSSTLVQGPIFSADYAIDNHTGGVYPGTMITHTDYVDRFQSPWWQVDLGENKQFNDIIIWNRVGNPFGQLSDFTVSVFDNHSNTIWTSHYDFFIENTTAGTIGETSSGMIIDFGTGISGEIVKIQNGPQAGQGYLALAEVQVLQSNNNPVPEPATMLLLGVGLLGIAGVSRKQK